MIENNLVKKLKALGVFVGSQGRLGDVEYGVSGRPDALVISPMNSSEKVKALIQQKVKLFEALTKHEKEYWEAAETEDFMKRDNIQRLKDVLYKRDKDINTEILHEAEIDPTNQIMLLEIKSIVTKGFEWRAKEGKPMDSHVKQVMFYWWKLKDRFKNMITRVIYLDNAYQDILEFNIEYDERIIDDLKKKWIAVKKALESKIPPPVAPDVVINPMNGKYQVNFQADWCNYHIKCTEDANWKEKAMKKVEELNSKTTRTYVRRTATKKDDNPDQPQLQGHQAIVR